MHGGVNILTRKAVICNLVQEGKVQCKPIIFSVGHLNVSTFAKLITTTNICSKCQIVPQPCTFHNRAITCIKSNNPPLLALCVFIRMNPSRAYCEEVPHVHTIFQYKKRVYLLW